MSGYLEVKYPFKSNLGLNPFKTWKRQWCILRPSPTCTGGGSLAVYCSEAGASAGAVELPADSVVRRAKSRSRPHAFAVFSASEPQKPRILLAAHTFQDAQLWMDKIRALLDGKQLLSSELLNNSYSVTIISTELSRKLALTGDGQLSLSSDGVLISRSQTLGTLIPWKYVRDATHSTDGEKNKICSISVHRGFHSGGSLRLSTPLAEQLADALARGGVGGGPGRAGRGAGRAGGGPGGKRLSKSEGDLRAVASNDDIGDVRRSSWSSGAPADVALDDTDLLLLKESKMLSAVPLARCVAALHLPAPRSPLAPIPPRSPLAPIPPRAPLATLDTQAADSSDRRSLASVASGIYEEIPEEQQLHAGEQQLYTQMCARAEPTYESVAELAGSPLLAVYATVRRARRPPPLPPRAMPGSMKLGSSWTAGGEAGAEVTRHGSLGSLPRCCSVSSGGSADARSTKTLPKDRGSAFSVFRKRLKSDSRLLAPKPDNKPLDPKKKKFDFTPPRDIFKNFKVGRKKNPKIAPGLSKVETKSCEFLDETEHVTAARGSKSVECLEGNDDFDLDLSLEFNDDSVASLALPQEIVDLIMRSEHMNKIRLKAQMSEGDYMPMSPICPPVPPASLDHYITMAPAAHRA